MSLYAKHVKEHLSKMLAAIGQDVIYERAEGNTIYYRNADGCATPVLDLLGGYGALILGHNHPEIVAEVKRLLDQRVAIHAQFSLREGAGELAARLNDIVKRDTGITEDFNLTFANSGAEAIEAALKHAELERVLKVQALLEDIHVHIDAVRTQVRGGRARIPENILRHAPHRKAASEVGDFDALIAAVITHNTRQLSQRPVFLVLERSFHGKLVGSVQLTYNKAFRRPFQQLGLETRFVVADRPDLLARTVARERKALVDLEVRDGEVRLVERELPVFAAFVVEPIQGEGGVHCLDGDFARAIRKTCNEVGCPLIADEIQSGMGRAGAFLAGSLIGLKADYYTLSKSLGGGIAKISALLIRKSRFRKEFGLIHSSTFAEDDFSSRIALKTLELLEQGDGEAYRLVRERGDLFKRQLSALRDEFPDIIKEVRGLGLFIGVEFQPQQSATSMIIRSSAYTQSLGYLLSGFLLKEQRIRTAPTGSAPNVLRIEPSLHITDEEIHRTVGALRRMCLILRKQDALHLVFHLTRPTRSKPRQSINDYRPVGAVPEATSICVAPMPRTKVRKVAFINHLITPDWLTQVDPSLKDLNSEELRNLVHRMEPNKRSAPYAPVRIRSRLGPAIDFILYPLCASSEQFGEYLASGSLHAIRADVQERVRAARDDGCVVAGLGMYTSIVTNNCLSVATPDIALTSGNALTIAMGLQAITLSARHRGVDLGGATAVVVGAAGNIGSTYATLLSESVARIILIGSSRQDSPARLTRTLHGIYENAWRQICLGEGTSALAAELLRLDLVHGWRTGARTPPREIGKALAEAIKDRYGTDPYVKIALDAGAIQEGHVVVCAANAPAPFLKPADFRADAVVCDIAVPNSVVPDIHETRPDLEYFQGGVVATPHGESLHSEARAFLGEGQLFACMAETAVLGLAGMTSHFSYGAVSPQQVREIAALAGAHGFHLASLKADCSL
jgi:acetylornithine/succinyldiaminopimelate/putrescine aminotransferase/predicted amino acid dehydrogenase